jgi:hypothetical protein
MGRELIADGGLEVLVVCQQPESQHCRPFEPVRGPCRLLAALALSAAPEEALPTVVAADARNAPTESAAHGSREQVAPVAVSGCVAALCGIELALIDQGGDGCRDTTRLNTSPVRDRHGCWR